MTDPQNPQNPEPTPGYTAPPPAAPAYSEQPAGYASAPPPAPGYASAPPTVPGKTLGIVALIVAIFFNIIGVILGIVALVQSRKAGVKNGPAVAAIIVGSILFVISVIVGIFIIIGITAAAGEFAEFCNQYGSGVHETTTGLTVTCP